MMGPGMRYSAATVSLIIGLLCLAMSVWSPDLEARFHLRSRHRREDYELPKQHLQLCYDTLQLRSKPTHDLPVDDPSEA